jgi:hypothetical protein
MRTRAHVVRDVGREHSAQADFVDDDHVIEALAADRSNQTLDMGVLPRRARCGPDRLDAHAGKIARDIGERAIAIMDEEPWGLSSGKAFRSCCATHPAVGWAVTFA